jgi:hypothetical protein
VGAGSKKGHVGKLEAEMAQHFDAPTTQWLLQEMAQNRDRGTAAEKVYCMQAMHALARKQVRRAPHPPLGTAAACGRVSWRVASFQCLATAVRGWYSRQRRSPDHAPLAGRESALAHRDAHACSRAGLVVKH